MGLIFTGLGSWSGWSEVIDMVDSLEWICVGIPLLIWFPGMLTLGSCFSHGDARTWFWFWNADEILTLGSAMWWDNGVKIGTGWGCVESGFWYFAFNRRYFPFFNSWQRSTVFWSNSEKLLAHGDPYDLCSNLDDDSKRPYPNPICFPFLLPHHDMIPLHVLATKWSAALSQCSSYDLAVVGLSKNLSGPLTSCKVSTEAFAFRALAACSQVWSWTFIGGNRTWDSAGFAKHQHFRRISPVTAPLIFGAHSYFKTFMVIDGFFSIHFW